MNWSEFVGPNSFRADGLVHVYLILAPPGEPVKLYVMDASKPLCPINAERALLADTFREENLRGGLAPDTLWAAKFCAEFLECRLRDDFNVTDN